MNPEILASYREHRAGAWLPTCSAEKALYFARFHYAVWFKTRAEIDNEYPAERIQAMDSRLHHAISIARRGILRTF